MNTGATHRTVCIAGLGLIGGSLAIDLRERKFAQVIVGVEEAPEHARQALAAGLVDEICDLAEGIRRSELIILATPVDVILQSLPRVLAAVQNTHKTVIDMGSTKAGLLRSIEGHPGRAHYVAVHPMAGTEYSGPRAAKSRLFDHQCAIICNPAQSAPFALQTAQQLLHILGMRVQYMDALEHDVSAAYVSHISHISSFALSLCVLEKEKDETRILSLASGGFASTVRLAKSRASTWVPIFEQNAPPVLEVLDTYIDKLRLFRKHIRENNQEALHELIRQANEIQKIIQ